MKVGVGGLFVGVKVGVGRGVEVGAIGVDVGVGDTAIVAVGVKVSGVGVGGGGFNKSKPMTAARTAPPIKRKGRIFTPPGTAGAKGGPTGGATGTSSKEKVVVPTLILSP